MNSDQNQKNTRLLLSLLGFVVIMIGVSFAAVPAYRMFCQVTGWGGTTQVAESLPDLVLERQVNVRFLAKTGGIFPWEFSPNDRKITVQLGDRGLTSYTAYNPMAEPVTGTAVYNVTPLKAGKYFHKIECFCFQNQTLAAGEKMNMPVVFYVDPALDEDPYMQDVKDITLSYTFFESEGEELDQAIEDFYNTGS